MVTGDVLVGRGATWIRWTHAAHVKQSTGRSILNAIERFIANQRSGVGTFTTVF
jgi:hypothetical protein